MRYMSDHQCATYLITFQATFSTDYDDERSDDESSDMRVPIIKVAILAVMTGAMMRGSIMLRPFKLNFLCLPYTQLQ